MLLFGRKMKRKVGNVAKNKRIIGGGGARVKLLEGVLYRYMRTIQRVHSSGGAEYLHLQLTRRLSVDSQSRVVLRACVPPAASSCKRDTPNRYTISLSDTTFSHQQKRREMKEKSIGSDTRSKLFAFQLIVLG